MLPSVSLIIPCRNEKNFIAKCLDSLIQQDYPKKNLEVLIIDGMSDDGSRDIIKRYSQNYSFIKILDNPRRFTPVAMNIGVKNAKGNFVAILSAHAKYKNNYVSTNVHFADKYKTDCVGGIQITMPNNKTLIAQSITLALSSSFGVGNAYYRVGRVRDPRDVDTVPFPFYKKEVFQKVGVFNEKLIRGQDMELNIRLKKAGGKILLHPEIISYYYPNPTTFKNFFLYNFKNGFWVIYSFKFAKMPLRLRHYVPLIFVLSSPLSIWPYVLLSLFFSSQIAIENKDFRLFFVMPLVFGARHFGYGLGSVWGLIKLLLPIK